MKMNTWKTLTVSSLVTLLFFIGLPQAKADESKKHIDVYKTPTCGCCVDWIKHIEEKDFITAVFHPENINELKRQKGIKPQYQSCHTGISKDGYIFEGHIPARFIKEYLENPIPGSIGLSVPGMPVDCPSVCRWRWFPSGISAGVSVGSRGRCAVCCPCLPRRKTSPPPSATASSPRRLSNAGR